MILAYQTHDTYNTVAYSLQFYITRVKMKLTVLSLPLRLVNTIPYQHGALK